jgi:hypothetical protein
VPDLAPVEFRLLDRFRALFEGHPYRHRASNQGDLVAVHLYEDLVAINRSSKFIAAVRRRDRVVNLRNQRRGIKARRGDATFGEIIAGETATIETGFAVGRGPIATVEIGVEVKILAKAMIKQIDRVINDLRNQSAQFKRGGGTPICVAIVGINHAERCVSYEGERAFPTTGKQGFLHPYQEAPEAERRLKAEAAPLYDEFLIVPFRATNAPPYPFEWVDYNGLRLDYGAGLTRVSSEYQLRF